jgi:hypothetical protein
MCGPEPVGGELLAVLRKSLTAASLNFACRMELRIFASSLGLVSKTNVVVSSLAVADGHFDD